MKKRFSEEQIIGFLREADAGMAVKDLCRRHGFSEASYYLWRSKFGGMSVSDAKRLKAELRRVTEERDILKKAAVSSTRHVQDKPETGQLGGLSILLYQQARPLE